MVEAIQLDPDQEKALKDKTWRVSFKRRDVIKEATERKIITFTSYFMESPKWYIAFYCSEVNIACKSFPNKGDAWKGFEDFCSILNVLFPARNSLNSTIEPQQRFDEQEAKKQIRYKD